MALSWPGNPQSSGGQCYIELLVEFEIISFVVFAKLGNDRAICQSHEFCVLLYILYIYISHSVSVGRILAGGCKSTMLAYSFVYPRFPDSVEKMRLGGFGPNGGGCDERTPRPCGLLWWKTLSGAGGLDAEDKLEQSMSTVPTLCTSLLFSRRADVNNLRNWVCICQAHRRVYSRVRVCRVQSTYTSDTQRCLLVVCGE